MSLEKSLEAVVWVAVGGRGTLIGPIIGSVGVNALKSWATRAYPDLWLIILGGLFVLIVLFMPKGIVGIPGQIQELRKRFSKSARHLPASARRVLMRVRGHGWQTQRGPSLVNILQGLGNLRRRDGESRFLLVVFFVADHFALQQSL
jgi:hypothetical protein